MPNQSFNIDLTDSFERIPVKIFPDLQDASVFIAQEIAKIIREKQAASEKCVLGLATGSSPKLVYAVLFDVLLFNFAIRDMNISGIDIDMIE